MGDHRPIIVLVHGAWQRQEHLLKLQQILVQRGFTVLQPQNATAGNNIDLIRSKTHHDDVAVIHDVIRPALDAGEEIVVICHSYGGIPASAALEGFQLDERRARGLAGGIKHIIYLAAVALPKKGLSLLATLDGQWPSFMEVKGDVVGLSSDALNALYNDQAPPDASRLLMQSVYQSRASLETPAAFVATDVSVPKTYIACMDDRAILPEAQLGMAEAVNAEVVKVNSGHIAYLNKAALEKIIDVVERVA